MNYITIDYIKKNPNIYNYLRENSYWYKSLNRNPESISLLLKEMKDKNRLTTSAKITDIGKKIEMVSTLIDILK